MRRGAWIVIVAVCAMALLATGVAAAMEAPPGIEAIDETTSTVSTVSPDTGATGEDATTGSSDTTIVADDETDTTDVTAAEHPQNFGRTISSMRAKGDHTPAAVVKSKKVPGYYRHQGIPKESGGAAED